MCEEKHQRTWEAQTVPAWAGRQSRPKEGESRIIWESDQLIVLSERESRSQGEGADSNTQPAKETLPGPSDRKRNANLPAGNSQESCIWLSCGSEYYRRARCGKTARRDLCGGCWVTGSPTAMADGRNVMKRTWTIIGVSDVAISLNWYQSLFGQPETRPAHSHFGQILDAEKGLAHAS